MIRLKYSEYIESKEWIEKSRGFREEVGKCERCGNKENLECHHITYETLFEEQEIDIEVLCKECHEKEHKLKEFKYYDPSFNKSLELFNKSNRWRAVEKQLPKKLRNYIHPDKKYYPQNIK